MQRFLRTGEPVSEPQRILIIKPSSLGDVVTTLPMLCDLRRARPKAIIDWLIAPAFQALVQGHDALDHVILFDRKELGKSWRSLAALRKFRDLTHQLKLAKYDCVIDAQGLLRSGYFSRVTGAPMRIGFADAREGANLCYTHRIPIRRKDAMSVVRMRSLLDPLNIPHEAAPEYRVPLDPAAVPKVAEMMPPAAVGIIPGSRGEGKRWPAEAFAAVISVIAKDRPIILLGSPNERDLCEQIIRQSGTTGHNRINLAGHTSVAEMIAALSRCDLVIGNDTGPLHVAVGLGRKVVGLYGRTHPNSVGPYGQLENVVRFDPADAWQNVWRTVVNRADCLLRGTLQTPA